MISISRHVGSNWTETAVFILNLQTLVFIDLVAAQKTWACKGKSEATLMPVQNDVKRLRGSTLTKDWTTTIYIKLAWKETLLNFHKNFGTTEARVWFFTKRGRLAEAHELFSRLAAYHDWTKKGFILYHGWLLITTHIQFLKSKKPLNW